MRPEEAWQSAIGEIEVNVGRGSYTTWLKSVRYVTYEDGQYVIGVPNGYVKEWMENRMLGQLKSLLGNRMGRGVDISFVLSSQLTQPTRTLLATAPISAVTETPVTHTNPSIPGDIPLASQRIPLIKGTE